MRDDVFTPEQLAAIIQEIEARSARDAEVLLHDLLCAPWPTREAQNQ